MTTLGEQAMRTFLEAARNALDAALEVQDGKFGIALTRARQARERLTDAVAATREAIESPGPPPDKAQGREGGP